VNKNLSETDRAMKTLERQKLALSKQTSETSKGKVGVDQTKKQLESLLTGERQKLDTEQKQIEELKKTLAQLEANSQKRQQNITQYEEKMRKVDTELASWSERNQSIIELEQALAAKQQEAKADNKRLADKRANYEAEIAKWKKQVRVSEREYASYSKLKD
jgi:chromosome segregation ATPase